MGWSASTRAVDASRHHPLQSKHSLSCGSALHTGVVEILCWYGGVVIGSGRFYSWPFHLCTSCSDSVCRYLECWRLLPSCCCQRPAIDHLHTLASLHWLCSSERIQYKLAMTVFWSLHGLAPPYLSDDLHRLVDIPSRRRLWSASSLQLDVSRTHRRTVGDRAFRCCRSDDLEQSATRHF